MTAEQRAEVRLTDDERDVVLAGALHGTTMLYGAVQSVLVGRVAKIQALADEWAAMGTVSVYESASELAQILRAALDGDAG